MRHATRHIDPDPRWITSRTWRAVFSATVLSALVAAALTYVGCHWSLALLVAAPAWAIWFYRKLPRWPENHVHCSIGWLADIICLFPKHHKSKSLKRNGQQFHAHQWVLATSLMRERRI